MEAWLATLFRKDGPLDHWQTLEAGVLAVLAAVLAAAVAYFVGWMQAEVARKAAKEQVAAADRQLVEIKAQLAYAKESDAARRAGTIESLIMGLSADAARLKMEVERIAKHGISGGTMPSERYAIAQANMLRMTVDVGHNPDLDALLDKETVAAARDMAAKVHQYNAVLLGGVVTGFSGEQWREPLMRIVGACDVLQKEIGQRRVVLTSQPAVS